MCPVLGTMAPPPGGGWFPSLRVARAMRFLTEWLVSFRVGLGRHCGAVQSLPKPLNETSVGSPLGFGASDGAMHSFLRIMDMYKDLQT